MNEEIRNNEEIKAAVKDEKLEDVNGGGVVTSLSIGFGGCPNCGSTKKTTAPGIVGYRCKDCGCIYRI